MNIRDTLPTVREADFTVDWRSHYESRMTTAEEGIARVKSGDRVSIARGREPQALGLALAARKDELSQVFVSVPQPGRDFGWYDEGWEASFEIEISHNMAASRDALTGRRIV